MSVLSKGLTFVPSRRQTVAQLTADLKEWERLMRLREYWYDAKHVDVRDRSEDDKYKSSRWTPPRGRDPWLDM